ncbi:MAG: tRNA lysidine(34) synthetase TilS [candidate division Zixibacteria bacterium]|nr:tRNA lysidine(34) synthetase TilS [candidate division Zixibacteria bacterium]
MIDIVTQTLAEDNLIVEGDAVLVALSGGPDSVALLHVLHQLKPTLGIQLGAVYVNHQIRIEPAAAEEEFCRSLCSELEIDFTVVTEDIPTLARENRKGIEETARIFRYGAFDRIAEDDGYDKIAVGHHADDQAETILFRILRGSGRTGLMGMPIRRGRIVRPLLNVTRLQIMSYIDQNALKYCTDETNEDMSIRRNFIRHSLLPSIRKQISPRVETSLLNLAETLALEEEFLSIFVERAVKKCISFSPGGKIELALDIFCDYDKWLRRRLLRRCLVAVSTAGTYPDKGAVERLDTACLRRQKAISLPKKIQAVLVGDRMVLHGRESGTDERQLERGRKVSLPGLQLSFAYRETTYKPTDMQWARCSGNVALDADKVTPPLIVRRSRAGDRFSPLGMKGSKTVNAYLGDRKLHRVYRDEIPVVCDQRGIIWLVGYEIADRVKLDKSSRKVIKVERTRRKENEPATV